MKIGTRTRYGLRTMLEIAQSDNSKGIFQKEIAVKQNLSNKYLDHIIHALKRSGLICNVKGKKSGYMLTRKPEEIKVYDVYLAFEADICLVECLSGNMACDRNDYCLAKGFWGELNTLIIQQLKSATLADFLNQDKMADELKLFSEQRKIKKTDKIT